LKSCSTRGSKPRLSRSNFSFSSTVFAAISGALAAEIKQTRCARAHEAQAARGVGKEERRGRAASQTKRKQLIENSRRSRRIFRLGVAAAPEIAAKTVELKEKFDRLSLGLDPRVAAALQGPRAQLRRAHASDHARLRSADQRSDRRFRRFNLGAAGGSDGTDVAERRACARFARAPPTGFFACRSWLSGSLNIQLHFKKIDTSRRNRFEVEVSFYGLDSIGKTPKVSFKASEKSCKFLSPNAELKGNDDILFRADGMLELSCQGNVYTAKEITKSFLSTRHPSPMITPASGWAAAGTAASLSPACRSAADSILRGSRRRSNLRRKPDSFEKIYGLFRMHKHPQPFMRYPPPFPAKVQSGLPPGCCRCPDRCGGGDPMVEGEERLFGIVVVDLHRAVIAVASDVVSEILLCRCPRWAPLAALFGP